MTQGDITGKLFEGPAVWKRRDLHRFPNPTCRSVDGTPTLSSLAEAIAEVRSELLFGPGFSVLHGFGPDSIHPEFIEQLCCELRQQVGEIVPQNTEGDLLRQVTDLGEANGNQDEHRARGHRGHARMSPHTDSADIVVLLCIRPARHGGANALCSSSAIHNEILVRRPEYLKPLYRGFYLDLTGKTATGPSVTSRRIPVFSRHHSKLSCVFNKERIILGMQEIGEPLDGLELEAVQCVSTLAESDEFSLRFVLKTGDVLFLNSHQTLHARDEYEDWPEADRKRLLLRLWLDLPRSEPIDRFGNRARSG